MQYIENYKEKRFGYDFYCDIAERIVEGRKLKGWTQTDLANAAKITPSRVSAMENVQIRFRLEDVKAIAEVLDVSVDWLIQADFDHHGQECLYLVWCEKFEVDGWKLYQRATSAEMAFLELLARMKKAGIRFLEPRDRARVRLVGIPVNMTELKRSFPKCDPEKDDPIEKN